MSVNVLPDMEEPRLRTLGKQLNRSRKDSLITRGMMRERTDVYVKSMTKAQRSLNGKHHIKSTRLKRKLSRVRGTQKCLKYKREETMLLGEKELPFGVYEGEKLDSYRRNVDDLIEKRHPKYRRQREVDKHLLDSKLNGRIITHEDAKNQFEQIMTNGHRGRKGDSPSSLSIKRENQLSMTFLNDKHGKLAWTWRSPNAAKTGQRSNSPFVNKSTSDNFLSMSGASTPRTISRGTPGEVFTRESTCINLPPITVDKNFMKSKDGPSSTRTSVTLPDLKIRRATKAFNSVSSDQLHKLVKLKGRRATTFL